MTLSSKCDRRATESVWSRTQKGKRKQNKSLSVEMKNCNNLFANFSFFSLLLALLTYSNIHNTLELGWKGDPFRSQLQLLSSSFLSHHHHQLEHYLHEWEVSLKAENKVDEGEMEGGKIANTT